VGVGSDKPAKGLDKRGTTPKDQYPLWDVKLGTRNPALQIYKKKKRGKKESRSKERGDRGKGIGKKGEVPRRGLRPDLLRLI